MLAPGGRVLIDDVRHLRQYAAILREDGVEARCVQGVFATLATVASFGLIQCGYVIGGKTTPAAALTARARTDPRDPTRSSGTP